jgi:hypothetical protein
MSTKWITELRHQATTNEYLAIPRVNEKRREVRRLLAHESSVRGRRL